MVKRNKTFKQKIIALANKRMGNSANEGRWQIKFTFDGKEYTKTHQLSEFEVRHMKDLCKQHGDLAADQLIWRAAITGLTIVTENVLAQAGQDYVKAHWKHNVFEQPVMQLKELGDSRPQNSEVSIEAAKHIWPEDDHDPVDGVHLTAKGQELANSQVAALHQSWPLKPPNTPLRPEDNRGDVDPPSPMNPDEV